MLKELEWDTLDMRRKKNRLALLHKLSHNLMDIGTEKYLVPNNESRTRKSHAFYRIPKTSEDIFKYSFEFLASRNWKF